jgi:uncharacterized membrane protein YgcG
MLLFLFLCLGGFFPVKAMIGTGEKISISSRNHFDIIWSFEFGDGGKLNMTTNLDNTSSANDEGFFLQLMFCTESQVEPLRSATFDDVCKPDHEFNCESQFALGKANGTMRQLDYTDLHRSWYHLLQLNCDKVSWQLTLDYVAVNPGGEYLSLSQVPYKTLFVVTMGIWAALALIWVYNWWRYRFFNIKIQVILTFVPITRFVISCISRFYWVQASRTGRWPTNLAWAQWSVGVFYTAVFFGCMLLISKGWMITRGPFTKTEKQRVFGLLLLLILSDIFFGIFGGFFLFFLVIMYVIILRLVFSSIVEVTQALTTQLHLVRQIERETEHTPVFVKLRMFKRFQVAIVVYMSVDLIFHLWAAIFLASTPWVEDAMDHILAAILAVVVGYSLAMRPFNPYYYRIVNDEGVSNTTSNFAVMSPRSPDGGGLLSPLSPSHFIRQASASGRDPLLPAGVISGDEEEDGSLVQQMWQPGMAVPKLPSDFRSWLFGPSANENVPVVVIETPDNLDDQGQAKPPAIWIAEPILAGPRDQPAAILWQSPASPTAELGPEAKGAPVGEDSLRNIMISRPPEDQENSDTGAVEVGISDYRPAPTIAPPRRSRDNGTSGGGGGGSGSGGRRPEDVEMRSLSS